MSRIYEAVRRAETAAKVESAPVRQLEMAAKVESAPVRQAEIAAKAETAPVRVEQPQPHSRPALAPPASTEVSRPPAGNVAGNAAGNVAKAAERRKQRRSKLGIPVRVRPSDPEQAVQFEDIVKTQNTSRGGLYLMGACKSYQKGMRLFITFPYSAVNPSPNSEYWGEVVRLDRLPGERLGVAVQLLGSMNLI